jgi:hypothetical protein
MRRDHARARAPNAVRTKKQPDITGVAIAVHRHGRGGAEGGGSGGRRKE